MASGKWTDYKANAFNSGSGTSSDPYIIANAEQLAYLAYKCNTGSTYSGTYFKITAASIDLSAHYWVPIGSYTDDVARSFAGDLDGNGCTITGMNIATSYVNYGGTNTKLVLDIGFVGRLNSASNVRGIRNLKFEAPSIRVTHSARVRVGVVAGAATGLIKNICVYEPNIRVWDDKGAYVGGIAGYAHTAYIYDCEVYSLNNTTAVTEDNYDNTSTSSFCIGGIVGYSTYAGSYRRNNVYMPMLQGAYSTKASCHIGGIVGSANDSQNAQPSICDCTAYVDAIYMPKTSLSSSGGIIGEIQGSSTAYIHLENVVCNCYKPYDINDDSHALIRNNNYHNAIFPNPSSRKITGFAKEIYYNEGEIDASIKKIDLSSTSADAVKSFSSETRVDGVYRSGTTAKAYGSEVLAYNLGENWSTYGLSYVFYRTTAWSYMPYASLRPYYKAVFDDPLSVFYPDLTHFEILTKENTLQFPAADKGNSVKVSMTAYTFPDKRYNDDLTGIEAVDASYTQKSSIVGIDQDYYIDNITAENVNQFKYQKSNSVIVAAESVHYMKANGTVVEAEEVKYQKTDSTIV